MDTHTSVQPPPLHSVLDALDVGVLVQGPRAEILFTNGASLRLLGLTEDELLGRTSFDPDWNVVRQDGSDFPGEEHPVPLAIATLRPVRDVVMGVWRPRSGDRTWLLVNAVPVLSGGALDHVICTFSDISSSRAEAARMLAESQDVYRSVIRAMSEGVAIHEADGSIRDCNPAAERALGLSRDQIHGRLPIDPRWRLVNTEGEPLKPEEIPSEHTRATGEPVHRKRLGVHTPDGELRWLLVSTDPVGRAAPDQPPVVVATFADITKQRQLEESLQRSQRMEAVSALAAGVAHNFNNVLTTILPNLEIALSQAGPAIREPLEDARQAARSAVSLVEQLLLAARGDDTGGEELCDLVKVLESVLAICKGTFDVRIQVLRDLRPRRATVMANDSKLQQVFLNLAINARDAVREVAQPSLKVQLLQLDPDTFTARFIDNGVGMDEAQRARLGEFFYTTKPPGQGTGLGLATAFGIIGELGGRIDCESVPGEGTTFTITLPAAKPAQSADPQEAAEARKPRVLIVDDEQLVRTSLKRLLRHLGLEVWEASDGEQALEMVNSRAFELVILDLSIPGMSGDVVLQQIKQLRPALKVAILTGHVDTALDLSAAEAVLRKPLSLQSMREFLARELGHPGGTGGRPRADRGGEAPGEHDRGLRSLFRVTITLIAIMRLLKCSAHAPAPPPTR
jgi:two-component system cell cycle sensor histidine kinase/response regulator CckA